MAHIDAGKTTTGEALLLLGSQLITKGEVDEGTTALDFLRQERERGITIQAAASRLHWREFVVSLIDTPGHVDFSMEVELSLVAADGVVVLLDGTRGVEAQTAAIWRMLQQRHHPQQQQQQEQQQKQQPVLERIPRLIFANKMDREGADMDACLQSVKRRLGVWPLQLNVAVRPAASTNEAAGATAAAKPLLHLIDLTDLCCRSYYLHPLGKRRLPLVVKTSPPPELQHLVDFPAATAQVTADAVASLAFTADRNQSAAPTKTFSWWQQPALLRQVLQRRQALLEDVSLLDETFEALYSSSSSNGSNDSCATTELWTALRRIVASNSAVPVLFGSARDTCGIELLLDAAAALLPSPLEQPAPLRCLESSPSCVAAFNRAKQQQQQQQHQQQRKRQQQQHKRSQRGAALPQQLSLQQQQQQQQRLLQQQSHEGCLFAPSSASIAAAATASSITAAAIGAAAAASAPVECSAETRRPLVAAAVAADVLLPHALAAAAAFKVLPDGRGGRLAYCRIFAGRLEAPCVLFNSSQRQVEVVQQLLLPAASAFTPTATAAAGDVAVLQGLQHTQAGDTLHAVPAGAAAVQQHQPQPASEPFVFQLHSGHARDHMEGPAASAAAHAGNRSSDAEVLATEASLLSVLQRQQHRQQQQVPVCFCSLDCSSSSEEQQLQQALELVQLQDPSLRFTRGEGEAFVLWGRGQLQLELVRDRLHTEFGVLSRVLGFPGLKTHLAPVEIAYKERLLQPLSGTLTWPPRSGSSSSNSSSTNRRGVGRSSSSSSVTISVELRPLPLVAPELRLGSMLKGEADPSPAAVAAAVAAAAAPAATAAAERGFPECTLRTLCSGGPLTAPGESADRPLGGLSSQSSTFMVIEPKAQEQLQQLDSSCSTGAAVMQAIETAAAAALATGPLRASPLDWVSVHLMSLEVEGDTAVSVNAAAATAQLLRSLLRHGRAMSHSASGEAANPAAAAEDFVSLAEPIMHVEVLLPAACVGAAATDLTQHREAHVISITAAHSAADAGASDEESAEFTQDAERIMQLDAILPLRCAEGYVSSLLGVTRGSANCHLRPLGYGEVSAATQQTLLNS
ncbi:ribosome-releasing factor 2, mitochondrial [Cyclospora cayetanensis]|uniref:Ribosome-releasing factor 2, mitochondrial n=1 Tax=Cyclospora cayetanensis TaxID=88456 RepID=A0A6P6S419_9EIME|nr:ribosome-releasing factor 2, mitochondrial [Cyclospora cayetanensis]